MEGILRAEIGERGVVRNLRDRPPASLLATLKRSTGNFANEAREGFPRRIKWERIAGPELTPAQMTDYVENEGDMALRFSKQPTTRLRIGKHEPEPAAEIKQSPPAIDASELIATVPGDLQFRNSCRELSHQISRPQHDSRAKRFRQSRPRCSLKYSARGATPQRN
jgi:hypothetical protein